MKVLVITNLFPNRWEPNRATFNYQQIIELSCLCNLTVIAPISWLVKVGRFKKQRGFSSYALQGGEINAYYPTYFYTPKFMRCIYGIFYFISIFFRASLEILKNRPNVILGTWAYPDGFAAIIIGKLFSIPVVIKVHGTDIHSVSKGCRQRITSWTLRKANKIISVSQNLSVLMQEKFSAKQEKIVVIRNGVDIDKFHPMDKATALLKLGLDNNDVKNIVFIGNLKPEKNPLILLKAYSQLAPNVRKKIKLHFIGDGPIRTELEVLINQENLGDHVVLYGSVTHTNIPIWLNAADVLVLPSLNEGMPNVVLEALACNTPVVASNVGGIPEVIDDGVTGFLFESKNINQLSKCLSDALHHNWDKEKFKDRSKNNTWRNTAEHLMQNLSMAKSDN